MGPQPGGHGGAPNLPWDVGGSHHGGAARHRIRPMAALSAVSGERRPVGLSDARRRQIGRLRRRRSREREGLVLVEGVRGVEDALDARASVRWAACAPRLRESPRGSALAHALTDRGIEVAWIGDRELDAIADTETCQGVLLVVDEPRVSLGDLSHPRRLLVADRIQDPGNLGTLVRAAMAFAVDAVIALDGTTDPWSPKAVRSAAGASFRIPIAQASWSDVRSWLKERETPLLVASVHGGDVADLEVGPGWALAVGSEARGPRPAVDAAAAARVAVPMPGGAESLNAGVAGAILLYALTRKSAHD